MSDDLATWALARAGVLALVLARTAGLAWTAPALATPGLGARLRFLLAGGLALVVAPAVLEEVAEPASGAWSALGAACVVEGLVGAALGWSAGLIVAGARQAGEIVGAQAGLSAAALFDPEGGDEMTPLGHLYGLVALGLFLALDGPLALVRGLVGSYHAVPAGGGFADIRAWGGELGAVRFAFGRVGEALALSLQAAAPAALALTLTGLALGVVARAAPSIQRAALLIPIRAALGLLFVLLGLGTLGAALAGAWAGWPGPGFDLAAGG